MPLTLSGFAHAGCGSINNDDLRATCYVEAGNGSCGSIKNDDLRRQCEMVKRRLACSSLDETRNRPYKKIPIR